MKKCLFGTSSNNCCAYCKLHHCSMTVKQMKAKNCLGKQCWHLAKNEEHQYWKQRAAVKQKRNERKKALDDYIVSITMSGAYGG